MPHEGQELDGPNGFKLRFVRIQPELLEMESDLSGEGPLPPAHLHPSQDERFEVLDGTVRAIVDGEERRYQAGDTFEIPKGTVHQMGGDGRARMTWEVRPALKTAELFEDLYAHGAAAKDPAAFLARYADEFRLAGPLPD